MDLIDGVDRLNNVPKGDAGKEGSLLHVTFLQRCSDLVPAADEKNKQVTLQLVASTILSPKLLGFLKNVWVPEEPSLNQALLEELKVRYAQDPNVRGIFVSGSVARGEAKRQSDLDIVLIVRKPQSYIRYYKGKLWIEVDSYVRELIPDAMREDSMRYYVFSGLKPLHDPESILP